jgi:CheY-like chemotaxis protein
MISSSILCVDDEPVVLRTTQLLLEMGGYVVSTAATAIDATRMLQGQRFDLLLTDCLPDWEQLVTEAKRINPDTRIAVCTGGGELGDLPLVDIILHKPVPPPQLLKAVAAELACTSFAA